MAVFTEVEWSPLGIVETLGFGSEDESHVTRNDTGEADHASLCP